MISAESIAAPCYGWIPNLKGDATETDRIERLMGSSDGRSEFNLIYELYEDEVQPSVAISPVADPEILIAPVDGHGMCVIGLSTAFRDQMIDGDRDPSQLFREYWMRVCEELGDGLSLGYGFVEAPIPLAEGTDVYNGVAESFITRTMKNLEYTSYNISFRMSLRYFQRDVRFDTRLSYYRRFLFIYSEQLGPSLPEYRSMAKRLSEINSIVEKSIERRYKIHVDSVTALFALATLIASFILWAANNLR